MDDTEHLAAMADALMSLRPLRRKITDGDLYAKEADTALSEPEAEEIYEDDSHSEEEGEEDLGPRPRGTSRRIHTDQRPRKQQKKKHVARPTRISPIVHSFQRYPSPRECPYVTPTGFAVPSTVEEKRAILEHAHKHGFVVIKDVVNASQLDGWTTQFWEWAEATLKGHLDRSKPSTWKDNWFRSHVHSGEILYNGIGQAPWMWELRLLPAVNTLFQTLLETDKPLCTSFEGMHGFCGATPECNVPLAIVQNPSSQSKTHCWRGALQWTDSTREAISGSVVCIPGGHNVIRQRVMDDDPRAQTYTIHRSRRMFFMDPNDPLNKEAVRLCLPKGSLLLWDALLPLTVVPPERDMHASSAEQGTCGSPAKPGMWEVPPLTNGNVQHEPALETKFNTSPTLPFLMALVSFQRPSHRRHNEWVKRRYLNVTHGDTTTHWTQTTVDNAKRYSVRDMPGTLLVMCSPSKASLSEAQRALIEGTQPRLWFPILGVGAM
jgi:hypothetical protein